jgi:hypothetical protein
MHGFFILGNEVSWSSSNNRVAAVSSTGLVTAVGPGRATITATASDGSNRRASCTVNVSVPASSLSVQGRKPLSGWGDYNIIAFGRSLQMNAAPGRAYGRVTNTRVTWTRSDVWLWDGSEWIPRQDLNSRVSISASGRLSVNRNLMQIVSGNPHAYFWVFINATAQDGSRVSGGRGVYLVPPTDRMQITTERGDIINSRSVHIDQGESRPVLIREGRESNGNVQWGNYWGDYRITSSNPRVLAIDYSGDDLSYPHPFNNFTLFYARGLSPGRSTVRVTSNDGTNKSTSFTITVRRLR